MLQARVLTLALTLLTDPNATPNPTLQARGLGPNSALLVATCMRANTALRFLDLSCNELGPHGAASLGEALQGNTVLTTLRLASNGLGREGGIALASNLPSSPLTLSLTLT